ncbi:MAG: HAD family phosphatase [Lachnospiraceae bacterium]|nr:HAD family phosphatase [Lachnospiraceae bacterium]
MIRNIVFDIGNVLADYRLKEFLAVKGFDAEMSKRILKASLMTPYWGQFERAEITEEEALERFASTDPDIREELWRAFSDVKGLLVIRDYSIPLIKQLKEQGYKVFYLSNYSKKAYDECGESLAFMEYMDGGLVSFKVGKTKPDPEMYRQFLDVYGLEAEECLFIDDTEENVEVAKTLGFKGIVFSSYDEMCDEIKKFVKELSDLA